MIKFAQLGQTTDYHMKCSSIGRIGYCDWHTLQIHILMYILVIDTMYSDECEFDNHPMFTML